MSKQEEKKVDLKNIGLNVGFIMAKHFYNTEYMHYGYWSDGLEVNTNNLFQAQENYANLLLSNIPEGVKSILDVGCGVGKFAEKLLDAGYEVDCVSPSPYLNTQVRRLLGNRSEIFECYFEHIETNKKYDLILFSESYQYIPVKDSLETSLKLLRETGYILIGDFFVKDVEGKSPISGGHNLNRFYKTVRNYPLTNLVDMDITKETALSLDLVNDVLSDVVHPIWDSIAYYLKSNYPLVSKVFTRFYKKKLDKMQYKYFSNATNGKNFSFFKSYRLLLYKKVKSPT